MMKRTLFVSLILSTASLPAEATDLKLTAGYDFTDYSARHGTRNVMFSELKTQIDDGTAVFNISEGRRDYDNGESWNALRGRATVWYNWNQWLSTKTGLAIAENTPVFARRDAQQDISVKVLPKTVFTFGYRYASYFDDTDVNAFSGGISLYTGPFITSWRYTHYDTEDAGGSYSHIVSLRLNDLNGKGNTQLWVSRGTGAYTYDWSPDTKKGTLKSISLRRNQPLTDQLTLGLALGKQWYDTPVESYHSQQILADLTWQF
ncbi:YaiO family outer membrane beta-barrel protein [Citrobacter braakii]|uniref:YaiO family outer membrane beta-barrel protein n=1 Tax=Citrobacter braakii TaxID=57706 RepID=UPI003D95BE53